METITMMGKNHHVDCKQCNKVTQLIDTVFIYSVLGKCINVTLPSLNNDRSLIMKVKWKYKNENNKANDS